MVKLTDRLDMSIDVDWDVKTYTVFILDDHFQKVVQCFEGKSE